jgi:hypothetical protein
MILKFPEMFGYAAAGYFIGNAVKPDYSSQFQTWVLIVFLALAAYLAWRHLIMRAIATFLELDYRKEETVSMVVDGSPSIQNPGGGGDPGGHYRMQKPPKD